MKDLCVFRENGKCAAWFTKVKRCDGKGHVKCPRNFHGYVEDKRRR